MVSFWTNFGNKELSPQGNIGCYLVAMLLYCHIKNLKNQMNRLFSQKPSKSTFENSWSSTFTPKKSSERTSRRRKGDFWSRFTPISREQEFSIEIWMALLFIQDGIGYHYCATSFIEPRTICMSSKFACVRSEIIDGEKNLYQWSCPELRLSLVNQFTKKIIINILIIKY